MDRSKASDNSSPVDYNVPPPRFHDMQGRELDPNTGRPLLGGEAGAGSIFHVPSAAPVAPASSQRPIGRTTTEKGSSTTVQLSYADLLAIARRQGFRGSNMFMNIIPYPEDEEQSPNLIADRPQNSTVSFEDNNLLISNSDQCRVCRTTMAGSERVDGFTLFEIRNTASRGCTTCNVLQRSIDHFSKIFFPNYKDEMVRVIQGGSENLEQLAQAKSVTVRFDEYEGEKIELSFYGSASGDRIRIGFDGRVESSKSTNPIPQKIMDTSSYDTITLIKKWLDTCNSEHPNCLIPAVSILPTRVLEVSNKRLRLVEPEGEIAPYFTLSHCWGKETITQLTTATLNGMKKNIPWTSLTETFQDAIMVTWKLGVRYLWIDGLCILQDSKEDWEYQASRMSDIFSNSQLTIAASHAASGAEGCFSLHLKTPYPLWGKQPRKVYHPALWDTFQTEGRDRDGVQKKFSVCIKPPHGLYNDITGQPREPLLKRSWVFQEQILSPRILHFASGELYFECKSHVVCECSAWTARSDSSKWETRWRRAYEVLLKRDKDKSMYLKAREQNAREFEAYRALVEAYTQLDITNELDRLPALSGVTSGRQDQYLAGMWRGILLESLHWAPAIPTPQTTKWAHRPYHYRAPTWSWASIESPIRHVETEFYKYQHSASLIATIISAHCTPEGRDPRGRVTNGTLKIRGHIVTAQVTGISVDEPEMDEVTKMTSVVNPRPRRDKTITFAMLKTASSEGRACLDVPLAVCRSEPAEVAVGQQVICLAISDTTGLVLSPVAGRLDTHVRVGIIQPPQGWTYGPQKTVVII